MSAHDYVSTKYNCTGRKAMRTNYFNDLSSYK